MNDSRSTARRDRRRALLDVLARGNLPISAIRENVTNRINRPKRKVVAADLADLEARGLVASWEPGPEPGRWYRITDAGRAWLKGEA